MTLGEFELTKVGCSCTRLVVHVSAPQAYGGPMSTRPTHSVLRSSTVPVTHEVNSFLQVFLSTDKSGTCSIQTGLSSPHVLLSVVIQSECGRSGLLSPFGDIHLVAAFIIDCDLYSWQAMSTSLSLPPFLILCDVLSYHLWHCPYMSSLAFFRATHYVLLPVSWWLCVTSVLFSSRIVTPTGSINNDSNNLTFTITNTFLRVYILCILSNTLSAYPQPCQCFPFTTPTLAGGAAQAAERYAILQDVISICNLRR